MYEEKNRAMTHSKTKRKGARWLHLGSEQWSYYVGKAFVEVTSPEGKKTAIRRDQLDVVLESNTDKEVEITLPGAVAHYIKANLR